MRTLAVALLVVLATPMSSSAQAGVLPPIDSVRTRFIQAVRQMNADSLTAVVGSEIAMVVRDSVVTGKERFHAYWADFFAPMSGPNPYTIEPIETRLLAPDVAVEIGNYGPISGPPVGSTMFVYKKWGPRWYLVYWRRGTPPLPAR